MTISTKNVILPWRWHPAGRTGETTMSEYTLHKFVVHTSATASVEGSDKFVIEAEYCDITLGFITFHIGEDIVAGVPASEVLRFYRRERHRQEKDE